MSHNFRFYTDTHTHIYTYIHKVAFTLALSLVSRFLSLMALPSSFYFLTLCDLGTDIMLCHCVRRIRILSFLLIFCADEQHVKRQVAFYRLFYFFHISFPSSAFIRRVQLCFIAWILYDIILLILFPGTAFARTISFLTRHIFASGSGTACSSFWRVNVFVFKIRRNKKERKKRKEKSGADHSTIFYELYVQLWQ